MIVLHLSNVQPSLYCDFLQPPSPELSRSHLFPRCVSLPRSLHKFSRTQHEHYAFFRCIIRTELDFDRGMEQPIMNQQDSL